MIMKSSLVERVLAGDPHAVARAISLVEVEGPEGTDLVRQVFIRDGHAYIIGITGPPGVGKSTFVDRLTSEIRSRELTVGVIAIDPTSPYTGGAVLGDRIRMQTHACDPGVFIRSMAARGNLGGVSRATSDAATILDRAGKDVILIETVGVGQDEVDIVRMADVSIVMVMPETGNEVQVLKAGIMEIADVFVVNKADLEGADRTVAQIKSVVDLQEYDVETWKPPVMMTQAVTKEGVREVFDKIEQFRSHHVENSGLRNRNRTEFRLRELLARRFVDYVENGMLKGDEFKQIVSRIADRTLDPYTAVDEIMNRLNQGN